MEKERLLGVIDEYCLRVRSAYARVITFRTIIELASGIVGATATDGCWYLFFDGEVYEVKPIARTLLGTGEYENLRYLNLVPNVGLVRVEKDTAGWENLSHMARECLMLKTNKIPWHQEPVSLD